jgi:hypothetical protein
LTFDAVLQELVWLNFGKEAKCLEDGIHALTKTMYSNGELLFLIKIGEVAFLLTCKYAALVMYDPETHQTWQGTKQSVGNSHAL